MKKPLALAGMIALAGTAGILIASGQSADITPPVISGISATNISASGATINWTTDEGADGQIEYGTSTAYGFASALVSATTTAHQIALTGLTASTTYHYRIKSKDASGNLAISSDGIVTTLAAPPADTTAPVISAVAVTNSSQSSVTIAWTTNEPADGQVQYGTSTAYGATTAIVTATTTAHQIVISGLTASTQYHYRVLSKDSAGNSATSNDFVVTTSAAPDTSAPVITGVNVSGITHTSATINWTTNEQADGKIEYGTSTSYGSASALQTALVTNHSIGIAGLTVGTIYYYRILSKDAAGNAATSSGFSFLTLSQTPTPAPTSTPPTAGVTLKVEPRVVNTGSEGNYIQAKLTIPGIYRNSDLNRASIKLNGTVSPRETKVKIQYIYDDEEGERGRIQIRMKFPREEVIQALLGTASSTATSTIKQMFAKEVVVTATLAGQTVTGTTHIRIFIPSWQSIQEDYKELRKQIREEFKEKRKEARERIQFEQEALKELRKSFKEKEKELKKKTKEERKENKNDRDDD